VIYSFDKLKELNPSQAYYYQHVVKAEKTGEREVTFTFDGPGNRELPHIVGQLIILPKHFWEGTDSARPSATSAKSTLEIPVGSGRTASRPWSPAAPSSTSAIRTYWGKDLR